MNEQDAVSRVADIFRDYEGRIYNIETGVPFSDMPDPEKFATAAITAYNAILRERSKDADVVEAAAKARMKFPLGRSVTDHVRMILTVAMDAMIGEEQAD